MSDELKPCPFCGNPWLAVDVIFVGIFHENSNGNEAKSFKGRVLCEECGGSLVASNLSRLDAPDEIAEASLRCLLRDRWNARAERTCRFSLEEDREMLAEKAACGPGEFVTQDMPDLLWTCSACGEQYKNGLDALPGWLKHCPNCGAKVTDE